MTLRIQITDVETGDFDECEVADGDYLLVCHEPCFLDSTQAYANGTHVLTVKGRTKRVTRNEPNAQGET